MKIGFAITGGGLGAVCACCAIHQLAGLGIRPQYIACSLNGVVGLLCSNCGCQAHCRCGSLAFLHRSHIDGREKALRSLCEQLPVQPPEQQLLLCCANTHTAQPAVFPMQHPQLADIACAAAGLSPWKSPQGLLCDFSSYFGCPHFPLKEAGADKVLALVYQPAPYAGPWENCRHTLIATTAKQADACLVFPEPQACKEPQAFFNACSKLAAEVVAQNQEQLCEVFLQI